MANPFGEEDALRKPLKHEIGQDLTALSIDELTIRVGLLHEEIDRLEAARTVKLASKQAADSFFKS